MAADLRKHAGDRDVTLALNPFAVGDGDLPPWTEQMTRQQRPPPCAPTTRWPCSLAPPHKPWPTSCNSAATPSASPTPSVNAAFVEPMAPVVELLNDRK